MGVIVMPGMECIRYFDFIKTKQNKKLNKYLAITFHFIRIL